MGRSDGLKFQHCELSDTEGRKRSPLDSVSETLESDIAGPRGGTNLHGVRAPRDAGL